MARCEYLRTRPMQSILGRMEPRFDGARLYFGAQVVSSLR